MKYYVKASTTAREGDPYSMSRDTHPSIPSRGTVTQSEYVKHHQSELVPSKLGSGLSWPLAGTQRDQK